MITRVSKVIVPVLDQQAALDFCAICMEFSIIRDDSYGDERWIEVKPPNQDSLLVLSLRKPDESGRTVPDRLPHSDLFFDFADIEQTDRRLSRRRVNFPLPPSKEHFGWWARCEDNEGSRYAPGQWDDHQRQTPDPALRAARLSSRRFPTQLFRRERTLHDGSMHEGEVVDGNLRFTGQARFTLIENEDGAITHDWELRDDDREWESLAAYHDDTGW